MGNPLRLFKHVNATTIAEATSALAGNHAEVIAGGTDILGTMKFFILPQNLYPEVLVNLKTISPSLDYIKEDGGNLIIGALTRLEDIAKSNLVKSKWAALAEAAHRTASPHIREMGTIGGNICQHNRCWYFWKEDNRFNCLRKDSSGLCYALLGDNRYHSIFGASSGCVAVNPSDTAPALVALNATVVTSKRSIPIDDFFAVKVAPNGVGSTILEKGEIVTEIQVPAPASGVKSAFVKFALRTSIDFPIVNCAAAIGGGDARICMNAVFGIPRRLTGAEDYIKDKAIDETSAEAAGAEAVKGAMDLGYNKWKIQVAKGMVKKALVACK